MKKISFAIIAAAILISLVFAACKGAETGKVSDTKSNDVVSEVEEMVTDAVTGVSEMLSDVMPSDTHSLTESTAE